MAECLFCGGGEGSGEILAQTLLHLSGLQVQYSIGQITTGLQYMTGQDRTGQHSKVYVYLTEIAAKITTNIINFFKLWFMLLILLNLRILQNNREILLNYLDKNT